jgi:hypothetical protein
LFVAICQSSLDAITLSARPTSRRKHQQHSRVRRHRWLVETKQFIRVVDDVVEVGEEIFTVFTEDSTNARIRCLNRSEVLGIDRQPGYIFPMTRLHAVAQQLGDEMQGPLFGDRSNVTFTVTRAICLIGTEPGRLTQSANRNTEDNLPPQRVTYARLAPENSAAGAHIERE